MTTPSRLLTAVVVAFAGSMVLAAQGAHVPVRVFASASNQFVDLERMQADLATADVAFLGEQHDDESSHRLELAILQGLALLRGDIVLSLEMFERDAQEPLDHFQMGHLDEGEFLRDARAWPRYVSDYKALVDFAITKNWPVLAANVPRAIAAEVTTSGLRVLESKPDSQRAWFAKDVQCPTNDRYFKRFVAAMNQHDFPRTPGEPAPANTERYYLAQCLKDETMGESISSMYAATATGGKRPLVVHIGGAFHSDFGDGVVARTRRRLPGRRVVVVSILPVADLDRLSPDAEARKRADYLAYVTK